MDSIRCRDWIPETRDRMYDNIGLDLGVALPMPCSISTIITCFNLASRACPFSIFSFLWYFGASCTDIGVWHRSRERLVLIARRSIGRRCCCCYFYVWPVPNVSWSGISTALCLVYWVHVWVSIIIIIIIMMTTMMMMMMIITHGHESDRKNTRDKHPTLESAAKHGYRHRMTRLMAHDLMAIMRMAMILFDGYDVSCIFSRSIDIYQSIVLSIDRLISRSIDLSICLSIYL